MVARKKKQPRSREYTGPKTVDGVIGYLETDAYVKAKEKAIAELSKEQQVELFERVRKRTLDAMAIYNERMNALARARGFKIPDE